MPGIYGGDDVSAIVLDIGTDSIRMGWAGQDSPRSIIKSVYGTTSSQDSISNSNSNSNSHPNSDPDAMQGVKTSDAADPDQPAVTTKVLLDTSLQSFRPNVEIHHPIQNSMLNNNHPKLLLPHILQAYSHLGANPKEHPLLITEPPWNHKDNREEIVAFAFETLRVPACYLANAAVLSSFASGKPTSLLLDVGSSHSSAIPIVDGFILRKAMRTQPLGGHAISKALKYDLENPPSGSLRLKNQGQQAAGADSTSEGSTRKKGSIQIVPRFRVKERKRAVAGATGNANANGNSKESDQNQQESNQANANGNANANANGGDEGQGWKEFEGRKDQSTKSYQEYHENLVLEELKESVGQVYPEPWNENGAASRPSKIFEFPTGISETFGIERSRAFELLFSPAIWKDAEGILPPPSVLPNPTPIPAMILEAISSVDVDNRAALYANIVIVGGSTMTPGFTDRISQELVLRMPGQKIKLHAPGNTIERRYSSWLGGSILASLGTFHQLWISRTEWDEHGRNIVGVRCK